MADRIRIGIIGGGIAGITTAISLLKHPHVDVQVYEGASHFHERGAGVGLSPLALEALDDIVPSAIELLKSQAGAVELDAARLVIGSGPEAGALVSDLGVSAGLTMNRASLLQTLLSLLPQDILHAQKRVKSVQQMEGGVTVAFEDGTDAQFDALIGADGIFSAVRNHVMGKEAEKHAASPAGWWDTRHLVPFEKARAALGDESFKVDRQFAWLGEGAAMLHGIVENRTMVQCIIAVIDKNFSADRKRPVTRQVLEDALPKSWYQGSVAKGMVEKIQWGMLSGNTNPRPPTPTTGSASSAMRPMRHLPGKGAGAGMVIEDAFILGHLIGNISSAEDINAAFSTFDAVRRPRCQRVIDAGRETGRLFCGQDEVAGLNPAKLGEALGRTFAHVGGLELKTHKEEALAGMRILLSN
ncbi:salicylate hydroxylase [Apiospora saccharicola]